VVQTMTLILFWLASPAIVERPITFLSSMFWDKK